MNSVGIQMSTRFSGFLSAVGSVNFFFLSETTYSSKHSFVACNYWYFSIP